jgi:hypothetical protein
MDIYQLPFWKIKDNIGIVGILNRVVENGTQ